MMRVLVCSYSDSEGGAARAAKKHFDALLQMGVDVELWTSTQKFNRKGYFYKASKFQTVINFIKRRIALTLTNLFFKSTSYKSLNLFSAIDINEINESSFDIVHLHWIGGECISIKDISLIKKPIVWTLHDMWAFMGIEHYEKNVDSRWMLNEVESDKRVFLWDIDLWNWSRKKRYWIKPFQLVVSSSWMQKKVEHSKLMSSWNATLIPNALDGNFYKPVDVDFLREQLGISKGKKIIMYGASGGLGDKRKGGDYFLEIINILCKQLENIHVIVFGGGNDDSLKKLPPNMSYHFLGHIKNDSELVALYSLADLLIVPSREDNLPLLAVEAQICGCPVIAFNVSGLKDIVLDGVTGYLIDNFEVAEMARLVIELLDDRDKLLEFREQARKYGLNRWSIESVIPKYIELYNGCLDGDSKRENKAFAS